MDNNYMDKKLKTILESPPDFIPDEAALNDMQQRLRAVNKPKQKRNILPFLGWIFLIPLLLSLGFIYKKYADLKSKSK